MGPEKKDDTSYDDDLAADIAKAWDELEREDPAEPEKSAEAASDDKPVETAEKDEKPSDGPARDENGRFKTKDEKPAEQQPTEQPQAVQEGQPAEKAPEAQPQTGQPPAAPVGGPPPSWSIKSKASWDTLPDHVRAEIAKRETEIAQGFAGLRETKELKPFADMAAQQGTTLPRMLQHYTQTVAPLERMLRQDLGTGLAVVAQNAGLNQQQAAQLFAQLAQRFGGQAVMPQSNGAAPAANGGQPGNELAAAFQPLLAPVLQEVQQLKQTFESRLAADRNAAAANEQQTIRKAWDAFASDPANRFARDVQADVAWLMDNGKVPNTGNWAADFKAAYDMACRMNPEIHEAQIEMRLAAEKEAQRRKEQEAAQRAKQASRSVTGSRLPGATVTERKPSNGSYDDDLMADVEAAYSAATGA